MTKQAYCDECGELHDVGGACSAMLAPGYAGRKSDQATPQEGDGFIVDSGAGATASAFGTYMGGYATPEAAQVAIESIMTLRNERRPIWRRRGEGEPERVRGR